LFVSIDNAEALLKTGGIGAEDMLLAHIGAVLRAAVGPGDSAARFGEYAFAVLVLRPAALGLMQLAQQIGHKLGDRVFQLGNSQQRIALSIGVTRLADRADALTHLSRVQGACARARGQSPGRIAQHGSDGAAAAVASGKALATADPLAEAIVDALVTNALETHYRPLMAVSARVTPARRFALEAWLPSSAAPDDRARRLVPWGETPLGELSALLDYWLMEQALAAIRSARSDARGTSDPRRLRLFVPQSMTTLRGRRWVLWTRDRLLELGPNSADSVVVAVDTEDVLAHLGVANTLFPLLARLRLRICMKALSTQPAALSLLTDYPITNYVEPAPSVLAAPAEQGELDKLITAAHAHRANVLMGGVADAESLSRAWRSGVDLAAGDFVEPASTRMDFDFGAGMAE
jgi:EAL domain-containing protein (putative c-di-GMP-specific phosphodiesterase class I)